MWISFRFGENAEKTGESGELGIIWEFKDYKWGLNEIWMRFEWDLNDL